MALKDMFYTLKADVAAALRVDPAATGVFIVLCSYAGVHALLVHRVAHWMWQKGLRFIPRMLSQIARFGTGIEIHPGAVLGSGLFIDHGMGVVIGETAEIGDNVTLFQGATLGGTGKQRGKRHPTLGSNIVVGAGAKILGPITIGDCVKVGANSVVLRNVPNYSTVVGIPGRIVKIGNERVTADTLFDHIHVPDPVADRIVSLQSQLNSMKEELERLHTAVAGGGRSDAWNTCGHLVTKQRK